RGATKKKRKSGIGLPRAVVYFDLQRLFYRFSCSKITQILTLEYEVVAMLVSKKPMVLVILDGYGYREEQQDNAIFSAKTPVMDA
ncbi:hypothetical protein, partial [Pseudomonas aeruginosa]|uniref:hypothetical protein n=1 Tax=Pseudomonas aeruginosa TaxID=287 RepID=UPI00301C0146